MSGFELHHKTITLIAVMRKDFTGAIVEAGKLLQ